MSAGYDVIRRFMSGYRAGVASRPLPPLWARLAYAESSAEHFYTLLTSYGGHFYVIPTARAYQP